MIPSCKMISSTLACNCFAFYKVWNNCMPTLRKSFRMQNKFLYICEMISWMAACNCFARILFKCPNIFQKSAKRLHPVHNMPTREWIFCSNNTMPNFTPKKYILCSKLTIQSSDLDWVPAEISANLLDNSKFCPPQKPNLMIIWR